MPDIFVVPLCRCGHPELDHSMHGQRACENGDGCGHGCSCKGYADACRPWRCSKSHEFAGPDEDDGEGSVKCPTCGGYGSPAR